MAFDYDGTHDLETSLQDSFGEAIVHGMVVSNLASFVDERRRFQKNSAITLQWQECCMT